MLRETFSLERFDFEPKENKVIISMHKLWPNMIERGNCEVSIQINIMIGIFYRLYGGNM